MKKLLILALLVGCAGKGKSTKIKKPMKNVGDWELIHDVYQDEYNKVYRTKTPHGWLVRLNKGYGSSLTYVPDPEHKWK